MIPFSVIPLADQWTPPPGMDVVWPLSSASRHDDWELRYSMRSFAANATTGRFWIIGHRPDWLLTSDKVRHIPHPDPFRRQKDANLLVKMLVAAGHVSPWFIFASDDQLVLRPVGPDDFGPWFEKDYAGRWPSSAKQTAWQKRVVNTCRMMHAAQLPSKHFDVHVPMPIHVGGLQTMLHHDFVTGGPAGDGCTFFSLYYNANRIEGLPINSRHVRGMLMSSKIDADTVAWKLENNLFCAYNDDAFRLPVFRSWVEARFPHAGPWEARPARPVLKALTEYTVA